MNRGTLLVLSMVAVVGCTTPVERKRQEIARHYKFLEAQAQTISVDTSDGISEVKAYKIGRDRFASYRIGCGTTLMPLDVGDYWRVTTCVGYFGMPFEDILIRKSDGTTIFTRAKLPDIPNQHFQAAPR